MKFIKLNELKRIQIVGKLKSCKCSLNPTVGNPDKPVFAEQAKREKPTRKLLYSICRLFVAECFSLVFVFRRFPSINISMSFMAWILFDVSNFCYDANTKFSICIITKIITIIRYIEQYPCRQNPLIIYKPQFYIRRIGVC